MISKKNYDEFVSHPRYGRCPHITGLNPDSNFEGGVFIRGLKNERIPNTAIKADLTKQSPATIAITHYFDLLRTCRDCGKSFIFFAQEQKYWYEELGFGIHSDCVRCVPCRKRQKGIAQTRERFEELFHIANRTIDQNLEMADCCLSLVEEGVFHNRQTERVRMLLNLVANDPPEDSRYDELISRLLSVEEKVNRQHSSQNTRS